MSYGFVIRYSYVSALQVMGSEVALDSKTLERLEQDRISKAKYLGPREKDPNTPPSSPPEYFRRYVDSKEEAGKFLDRWQAIDWAQQAFNRAPHTEKGLIIEVISLEDNLLVWSNKK